MQVEQNKTTTLQVQQPGKLNVVTRKKLEMGIYYRHNGELELIKNIYNVNGQDITVLQPGDYKLIYKEAVVKES